MTLIISKDDWKRYLQELDMTVPEFPKYVTQLLNLANQNSGATGPKNVGHLSELMKEFPGRSVKEWEEWYVKRYPRAIDEATEKIWTMINNLKSALNEITKEMIKS